MGDTFKNNYGFSDTPGEQLCLSLIPLLQLHRSGAKQGSGKGKKPSMVRRIPLREFFLSPDNNAKIVLLPCIVSSGERQCRAEVGEKTLDGVTALS